MTECVQCHGIAVPEGWVCPEGTRCLLFAASFQNELREELMTVPPDWPRRPSKMDGNSIVIVGNLTRDIEVKFVGANNIPKGTFSVARSWYVGEGESREQRAEFFDCEVWREQATNLAQSVGKGDRVIVSGILRQDRWQNAEGESRTKVRIEVVDVGPALRFATASVTKNARPDQPAPESAPAPAAEEGEDEVVFSDAAF